MFNRFFMVHGKLEYSYLLLKEKDNCNNINIKEFYLRRIFRIWPLYYFYIIVTLLLTTIIFGYTDAHISSFWLYIFFIPNIAFNLNIYPSFLGHLWSIGIEEQFYAIWPHFVGKTTSFKRGIVLFIVLFIILKLGIKVMSIYFNNQILFSIIASMGFDCMAIGALFAIIHKEGYVFKNFFLLAGQLLFWVLFITSFFTKLPFFSIYGGEVFSILTGFFILGQLDIKKSLISLERPLLNFLGKISFGLYVYHPLAIFLFQYILFDILHYKMPNTLVLVLGVLTLTIAVSFFSYKYIESYFLQINESRNAQSLIT